MHIGNLIEYDGTVYHVINQTYEYHAAKGEECTIVHLRDDEGNECQATLDELKDCPQWPAGTRRPNGTLTHTDEHGHVWTTACRKCGTEQKVRIGNLTLSEARRAIGQMDNTPYECPGGFHVELNGPRLHWSLDLLLTELARDHAKRGLIAHTQRELLAA